MEQTQHQHWFCPPSKQTAAALRAAMEGKWPLDETQTHLESWPCSFKPGVDTFWVDFETKNVQTSDWEFERECKHLQACLALINSQESSSDFHTSALTVNTCQWRCPQPAGTVVTQCVHCTGELEGQGFLAVRVQSHDAHLLAKWQQQWMNEG